LARQFIFFIEVGDLSVLKILKWLAIGFIGLIVIAAIFGESKKKETTVAPDVAVQVSTKQAVPANNEKDKVEKKLDGFQREIGEAKPYQIIVDNDEKDKRRATIRIISSTANSKADRAATVKQAVLDSYKKTGIPVISAYLELDPAFKGQGAHVADATYFSAGCGFSAKDCDGIEWKLDASDVQISERQLSMALDWEKYKARFTDKNNELNEAKLEAFLAKKYKVAPEQFTPSWPSNREAVNPYTSKDEQATAQDRILKIANEAKKREKAIKLQFSSWSGAHRKLEKMIKENMNDKNSYEHVSTNYFDMGDHLIVNSTYRGKNSYGAVVKGFVKAKISIEGDILSILDES
jgi:hypothetical protein